MHLQLPCSIRETHLQRAFPATEKETIMKSHRTWQRQTFQRQKFFRQSRTIRFCQVSLLKMAKISLSQTNQRTTFRLSWATTIGREAESRQLSSMDSRKVRVQKVHTTMLEATRGEIRQWTIQRCLSLRVIELVAFGEVNLDLVRVWAASSPEAKYGHRLSYLRRHRGPAWRTETCSTRSRTISSTTAKECRQCEPQPTQITSCHRVCWAATRKS